MIPRNELRIGNLIFDHKTTIVGKVTALQEKIIKYKMPKMSVSSKMLPSKDNLEQDYVVDPIPITKEMMQKTVFVNPYGINWKMQIYNGDITKQGFDLWVKSGNGQAFIAKVEYMHQLQNLMFALTGIEIVL